jgi:hypothetical protein
MYDSATFRIRLNSMPDIAACNGKRTALFYTRLIKQLSDLGFSERSTEMRIQLQQLHRYCGRDDAFGEKNSCAQCEAAKCTDQPITCYVKSVRETVISECSGEVPIVCIFMTGRN